MTLHGLLFSIIHSPSSTFQDALRQGSKLILPPMTSVSSPALLDAIDVNLLIRQLQIHHQVSNTTGGEIDLTKCMGSGSQLTPPRANNEAISSYSFVNGVLQPIAPTAVPSPSPSPNPPGHNPFASPSPPTPCPLTSAEHLLKDENPQLSLKELNTGLTDDEAKLLTFLTFTLSTGSPPSSTPSQPNPLYQASEALRTSLAIPNDAAEGFKSSVFQCMRDMFPEKRVTLEGLVTLMVNLRPPIPSSSDVMGDNSASGLLFAYSLLQSTLFATIKTGFALNAAEGWTSPDASEARRILAKMRAALRRISLDSPDDYDAEDHYEAGQCLWFMTRSLSTKTRMGWKLPWCIRVQICEVMQQGRQHVGLSFSSPR
jgi:hypothetical protein